MLKRRAKFREHLKTSTMSQTEMTWVTRAGRVGYAARGVVFLLIGWCEAFYRRVDA